MSSLAQLYGAVRWRFIPVRYAGKVRRSLAFWRQREVARSGTARVIRERGFADGPSLSAGEIEAIQAIYRPRVADVVESETGHPFVNLFRPEDAVADNPVFRFALSPAVLDVAHDYFGGRFRFDSIQVLYTWATSGELRESQKWHRDYGDRKSFHCVAYLNDVMSDDDGPFVFVDRRDSRRIGARPFIRRIADARFSSELGPGAVRKFCARAGSSVLVDPAACYHYGSRCKRPRLAVFATFNTDRPYVPAVEVLRSVAPAAAIEAAKVRPDLNIDYLGTIFEI